MSEEPYVLGVAASSGDSASSLRGLWPTRSREVPLRSVLRASSSRSGQFQQVVGTADETPLTGDLRQAPQQELSEAASLFDLAKHGFDHLLAQPIATPIP